MMATSGMSRYVDAGLIKKPLATKKAATGQRSGRWILTTFPSIPTAPLTSAWVHMSRIGTKMGKAHSIVGARCLAMVGIFPKKGQETYTASAIELQAIVQLVARTQHQKPAQPASGRRSRCDRGPHLLTEPSLAIRGTSRKCVPATFMPPTPTRPEFSLMHKARETRMKQQA